MQRKASTGNEKRSLRGWQSAILTLGFGLWTLPASASDQAIFGTMKACRSANAPLAQTIATLDQLGWQQVTRRSDRSKIASHMSAGVHHTPRSFDKGDYREMQKMLLARAGKTSHKVATSTRHHTVVYYALEGSLSNQLVVWDEVSIGPSGQRVTHSRTCFIATQSYPSVQAFAKIAEPVPHLGVRRMKGQWVDPRTRRYWVRASHRQFPETELPFRPEATDFIRIDASSAGNT